MIRTFVCIVSPMLTMLLVRCIRDAFHIDMQPLLQIVHVLDAVCFTVL